MRRYLLSTLLGAALAGCAMGQDADSSAQAAAPAPQPCDSEGFHDFDFWLGTWDVTTANGQFAGTNVISREESGCLLLEKWTSVNGGTGQSYNYFNPATSKWRQVWVSTGAMIDYEGGLTETGSMKLEGTITYPANAQSAQFTGEWTPNEDGTVTQHFEQYNAQTEEWAVWFTGIYTKKDLEPATEPN